MKTLVAKRAEMIFKSDNPDFNYDAAKTAHDLVMKMDTEGARAFTTMVVLDNTWDYIEKNQRSLQSRLDRVVAKRLEEVSKAMNNVYISKRLGEEGWDEEQALARIGALSVISKATRNQYMNGRQFDENDVRRGPGGQFSRKPKKLLSKPLEERAKNNLQITDPTSVGARKGKIKMTREQQAKYHSDYIQIAQTLDMFNDDGVDVTVRNLNSGTVTRRPVANKGEIAGVYNPTTEVIDRINAEPGTMTVGGASFNMIQALGGDSERAYERVGQIKAAEEGFDSFQNSWIDAGDGRNSNSQRFNRLEAGSQYLGQIAPAGSKTQMAAFFGEYVGNHGPEAEKIVGPTMRRTAYRYRGTERNPETALTNSWRQTVERAPVDERGRNVRLSQAQRTELGEIQGRAQRVAINRKAKELKKHPHEVRLTTEEADQINNRTRVKYYASHPVRAAEENRNDARQDLGDKMRRSGPRSEFYQLQVQSGHLPPSEGVIIDRKGVLRAQAVGYADDHYLPFNLKNIGSLRGGEYIRTRSVGGPTSEDIYTGLVGGAQAITVASRSGTFVVEFEPDFTGTRRYNDKAKRMVDRYEKLLDAVRSGQVERADRQEVPEFIRDRITTEIEDEHYGKSKQERADILKTKLKEYRTSTDITDLDREWVKVQAADLHRKSPKTPASAFESELMNTVKDQKEFNYQLNGRGYEAALHSLREQFPYYIKSVRRIPVQEDRGRGASTIDQGYVQPRYNRPVAAQAGYFDKDITGEGKFDANQADYQNYKVQSGRQKALEAKKVSAQREGDAPAQTDEDGKPVEVPSSGTGFKPRNAAQARDAAKDRVARNDMQVAAEAIADKLQKSTILGPSDPLRDVTPKEFANDLYLRGEDSKHWPTIEKLLNRSDLWSDSASSPGPLDADLKKKLMTSMGMMSGGRFTPANAFLWPQKGLNFDQLPAYRKDADQFLVDREMGILEKQGSLRFPGEVITKLTDGQLKEELGELRKIRTLVTSGRENKVPPSQIKEEISIALGKDQDDLPEETKATIRTLMRDGDEGTISAEKIHRLRALRSMHGGEVAQEAELQQASGGDENNVRQLRSVKSPQTVQDRAQKMSDEMSSVYEGMSKDSQYTQDAKNEFKSRLDQLRKALAKPDRDEGEVEVAMEDLREIVEDLDLS